MNRVILIGRLTKDPDVRYSQGDNPTAIAKFNMAVDRKFGKGEADFPSCVAFGKTAEFIEKYGNKGTKFVVEGRLQTGSYEKDGKKVYTTDVVVESVEFAESKQQESKPSESKKDTGFIDIPDAIGDELPFV